MLTVGSIIECNRTGIEFVVSHDKNSVGYYNLYTLIGNQSLVLARSTIEGIVYHMCTDGYKIIGHVNDYKENHSNA